MLRIFRPKACTAPPANLTLRPQLDRAADEPIGLCRGVLADCAVPSQGTNLLLDWCERNAPARTAGDSGARIAPTGAVEQSNPLLTLLVGFDRLQKVSTAISPDQAGNTTERSNEN